MPEASARNFAPARRRDGFPIGPAASGRQCIIDVDPDLNAAKQTAIADHAPGHMHNALAALQD